MYPKLQVQSFFQAFSNFTQVPGVSYLEGILQHYQLFSPWPSSSTLSISDGIMFRYLAAQ